MSEVAEFLDAYAWVEDVPMRGERIFPKCRVCGHRIKKRSKLLGGPYCPHCERSENHGSVVAVIRYRKEMKIGPKIP